MSPFEQWTGLGRAALREEEFREKLADEGAAFTVGGGIDNLQSLLE